MVTKIAIPQSSVELEEFLHDSKRAAEAFATPQSTKEFMDGYAQEFGKQDKGELDAQLKAQMEEVAKRMYEENNTKKPGDVTRKVPADDGQVNGAIRGRGSLKEHAIYRDLELSRVERRQIAAYGTGPGMEVSGFENFIDFALGISPHITKSGIDSRVKVLGEGAGDAGGFLVPEEFRAELLMNTLEMAVIRPRARVLPMAGLTVRIPAIRDTTHATNVFGGVQAFWTPESGTFTQTDPTFAQAVLTAKKLMGGTRVGNELLRDSAITFEPLINTLFSQALAYFEDDAFMSGVGGGQPLGILNADALVSVAKETGQAATTLVTENVIKVYSRMLPQSISRAIWIMHPDVQPQLYTMSLSVGTGGAPMFFPAGGLTGSPTPTLLGRPIVFSEKAQTLGTAGDVYLVDLSYYLIGDRMALEMASSPHVRFNTDETDFRFIQRVDGRPWIDSALTPRNGANTLSPFMAIATRA